MAIDVTRILHAKGLRYLLAAVSFAAGEVEQGDGLADDRSGESVCNQPFNCGQEQLSLGRFQRLVVGKVASRSTYALALYVLAT